MSISGRCPFVFRSCTRRAVWMVAAVLWSADLSVVSAQTAPDPAAFQAPSFTPRSRQPGKWQFEIYGSGFGDPLTNNLPGAWGRTGTGIDTFPAGAPFTTAAGGASRVVSSWAFGDGALLFEQFRMSMATNRGVGLAAITPLDEVLRTRGTVRTPKHAVGVRMSRHLTSWLAAEVAVDRGRRQSRLSDEAAAGLEATRVSYVGAFQSLLDFVDVANPAPLQGATRVTSVVTSPPDASDSQTTVTGSAVISFLRTDRLGLHALVGGGVIINDAPVLDVQMQSSYEFLRLSAENKFSESETVAIRFADKKRVPTGVAGLGLTLRLAGNSGLRADARVLASANRAVTTVDASVARAVLQPGGILAFLNSSPSIQFSSRADAQASLGGGPIDGLVTYTGRGVDLRPQITLGYYVRF